MTTPHAPRHDGGEQGEDREVRGDGGEDTDEQRAEVDAGRDRPGADTGAERNALHRAVRRRLVDMYHLRPGGLWDGQGGVGEFVDHWLRGLVV
ncbi:MAG: hypothetical protein JF597_26685 [Streptomyces sp.]|nr:hypothetical protein [Streptomyces sp.]